MKISVFYDHIREAAEQSGQSMDEVFQKVESFGIKGIEIEDRAKESQRKSKGNEVVWGFRCQQESLD